MRGSAKVRQHSYSYTAQRHNNKFPSGVTTGTWVTMAFGRLKDQLAMEKAAITLLALSAERGTQQAMSDAAIDVQHKESVSTRARALQIVRHQANLSFDAFVEAGFARVRAFVEAEQPRETSPGIQSDNYWIPEADPDWPQQHEVEESEWDSESDEEIPQAAQTL